jgi:hypothetical protein
MEEEFKIDLQCLFCKSKQFEIEEGRQYTTGDMIQCANCGRLNSYESLCNVAKEKGIKIVEEEAEKLIKDAFKDFKL